MITLEKSFRGHTVHIVGHLFIYSWTTLPISELDAFAENYSLSKTQLARLKKALADHPQLWGDNEDWDACAKHPDYDVRIAVAKQGKCLNLLMIDVDEDVRRAVALQNHRLDVMVNDEAPQVRREIASKSLFLEKLVHDPHYSVRVAVANQGFGHDILKDDEHFAVRKAVRNYIPRKIA